MVTIVVQFVSEVFMVERRRYRTLCRFTIFKLSYIYAWCNQWCSQWWYDYALDNALLAFIKLRIYSIIISCDALLWCCFRFGNHVNAIPLLLQSFLIALVELVVVPSLALRNTESKKLHLVLVTITLFSLVHDTSW